MAAVGTQEMQISYRELVASDRQKRDRGEKMNIGSETDVIEWSDLSRAALYRRIKRRARLSDVK